MNFSGLAILIGALIISTAHADHPMQDAPWKTQSVKFVCSGFTTHYSCDGREDKMRRIVLALGHARMI